MPEFNEEERALLAEISVYPPKEWRILRTSMSRKIFISFCDYFSFLSISYLILSPLFMLMRDHNLTRFLQGPNIPSPLIILNVASFAVVILYRLQVCMQIVYKYQNESKSDLGGIPLINPFGVPIPPFRPKRIR